MKKKLLILIGTSGSGKSYFSNKIKSLDNKWEIISSDKYRLKTSGEVNIFKHPIKTFKALDKSIIKAFDEHDYVIYDACNISKLRRLYLFFHLKYIRSSLDVTGIVFSIPIDLCLRQNKSELRDHHVKSYIIVISKILIKFNRPSLNEGFDKLIRPEDFIYSNYNVKLRDDNIVDY